jgi:DNA cross-link repair 1B protein
MRPPADTWRGGPVFCSAPTAALLALKFPSLAARRGAVTALPLDETSVLRLPPAPGAPPGAPPAQLCVTPIDTGHCPGSVAFLFEGACGRVFHTGDWRRDDDLPCAADDAEDDDDDERYAATPSATPRVLPAALLRAPVDVLYLDNTFCHPAYGHPPRRAAAAALAALLRRHAGARFVLGIDTLGKEELLELAARVTGGRVCVTPARVAAAAALGRPTAHLTTRREDAAVWTVPRWQLTQRYVAALNACERTVGILPTGWPGGGIGLGDAGARAQAQAQQQEEQLVHCVPYSLHAPFLELRALVAALRPRALVGVVAAARYDDRPNDPRRHFAHLLAPPASPARGVAMMPPPRTGGDADAAAAASLRPPAAAVPPATGRKRVASPPRVCAGGAAPGELHFERRQAVAAAAAAAFTRAAPRRRGGGTGLRIACISAPPPLLPPKIAAAAAADLAATSLPLPPASTKAEAAAPGAVAMPAMCFNAWAVPIRATVAHKTD